MFKQTIIAAALGLAAFAAQANIVEGFDNVSTLPGKGFTVATNVKSGLGYSQGNQEVLSAQAGAETNSFFAMGYNFSAGPTGVIDTTLITPLFSTTFDVLASFFASAEVLDGFSDNFQFGFSTGSTDINNFTFGAVITAGSNWTSYQSTFIGTGDSASVGRFAIRYVGSANDSNYLGIDTLAVTQVPEPASVTLLGLGLAGLIAARRKKSA